MKRVIGVVAIVLAYLAGLNLAWGAAQIRVWNYFNSVDLLVIVVLVAPFLASPWVWPSALRATRVAWFLAAFLALDVPFFAIMTFSPGGGHPSLESLFLYFTSLARIALVPAAIAALCTALWKGERALVVALGVICVVCETVYTVPGPDHPIRWLLVRYWVTGAVA